LTLGLGPARAWEHSVWDERSYNAPHALAIGAHHRTERMCWVIYVYGDDSADEKKERVVAVAVIGGTEETWSVVENKWLARTRGVPFHANDCESDQGDYKNNKHADNKALYRDLTTILAESDLGGLGLAIDVVAQQKIFPGSFELAYYEAFLEALTVSAKVAKSAGQIAELTFDISADAWTRSRCTNWLELAPGGRSAIGRRLTIRLTELGRLSVWRLLTGILIIVEVQGSQADSRNGYSRIHPSPPATQSAGFYEILL
jgi:hypothetical protein